MPTITVSDNITFEYIDSGHIPNTEYTTCVIVHGHSFHSGIFKPLFPFAQSRVLRIICVNRRSYPGTTPYTEEELTSIGKGTDEQRGAFLRKQGVLLALFIDGIIQRHNLPQKGGVALVGWSMGNIFAMGILAALQHLPHGVKDRLAAYIHSYVAWDPPYVALGIPSPEGAYMPLWSDRIPPEDRGRVFGTWVSGYFTRYFTHDDQASDLKDFALLNQQDFDMQDRPPTVSRMSAEEIQSAIATQVGMSIDTPIIRPGGFESPLLELTAEALFDDEVRKEWKDLRICVMCGEANAWPMIYAVWVLEKMGKGAQIEFKPIPDANHFLMWDDPERGVDVLKECIAG